MNSRRTDRAGITGLSLSYDGVWLWTLNPAKKLGTVLGWRPSLGLVGGLHSARPRVLSRKAVAISWLGFDTDYG